MASEDLTRPSTRSGYAEPSNISRVPYLPGLDGMRALAVVAVMIYHANSEWLPGGFLGVEVFFVISGYLITLLLIGRARAAPAASTCGQFWAAPRPAAAPGAVPDAVPAVDVHDDLPVGRARQAARRRGGGADLRLELVPDLGRPGLHRRPATSRRCATCGASPSRSSSTSCGRCVMVVLLRVGGTRRLAMIGRWLVIAAAGRHRRDGVAVPRRARSGVRRHARRLLDGRRPVPLEGRHAVPVDDHPVDRAAARRGVRDGVAAAAR